MGLPTSRIGQGPGATQYGAEHWVVGFGIMFGGIVMAAAIAFGLGAKDLAKEFLEQRLSNKSRDRALDDLRHLCSERWITWLQGESTRPITCGVALPIHIALKSGWEARRMCVFS